MKYCFKSFEFLALMKLKALVDNMINFAKMIISVIDTFLFAHLSTKFSKAALRSPGVHLASSTISLKIFSSQTAGPIWTKLAGMFVWRASLKKMFTEFDSIKNSGCHGNKMNFFKQFFKNLLLWNSWSNFEIINKNFP